MHFLFLKRNSIGAYNKILNIYGKDIFIQTLSRDNTLANAMKFEVVSNELLLELASKDSYSNRYLS